MRTRRRLKKQLDSRWRRLVSLSLKNNNKVFNELKTTDMVVCVDTSIIDAIRLHTNTSRTEALAIVLNDLFNVRSLNFGTYQIKVANTPVVYSISLSPLSGGKKRADITLNAKVIVFSVDTLSSLIADETLQKALDGQS